MDKRPRFSIPTAAPRIDQLPQRVFEGRVVAKGSINKQTAKRIANYEEGGE